MSHFGYVGEVTFHFPEMLTHSLNVCVGISVGQWEVMRGHACTVMTELTCINIRSGESNHK